MVAVNSLLYFLLSAGLSGKTEQAQDVQNYESLNGIDIKIICPAKEHFSECNAHCQKNCTNFNKPIPCPRICVKGCVCDEGLVRGSDGKCISPKQCPGRGNGCSFREHLSYCEAHCQKNCTNFNTPFECPKICIVGCVCDESLVRSLNGSCILPRQCPGKDICPRGEHFDQCNSLCQRNCTNYGKPMECEPLCFPGCVCNEGTVRGPNERCIKPDKCPKKSSSEEEEELRSEFDIGKLCPPREHFSECNAHCQKNCTNYNKPIPCPRICVKGCVCDEGLVRGSDGKCISPKQCPARDTCPRGEHYDQCRAHCQWNCTTYGKPIFCPRICAHGCVCNEGTVRGPNGRCIKPDTCPKIGSSEGEDVPIDGSESFCPLNEIHSSCLAHCQRDCSNWDDASFSCSKMCSPGCICDRGMIRGADGQCIRPEQCPPKSEEDSLTGERCPRYEKFSPCTAHCQTNCSNYKDKFLPCTRDCNPGCICQDDMVRGPEGKCIYPNDCPWIWDGQDASTGERCPRYEKFSPCTAHCQTNCSNYKDKFLPCTRDCNPGCICQDDMVRGPEGKCIYPNDCPWIWDGQEALSETEKSCPPKEHLSECNAHCQKNCTNYNKPTVCPAICIKGCVCDKGLVRSKDGKCVLPKQCPGRDVCPRGEHYDQCNAHCQRSCSTWGKPLPCPLKCEHGCVCDRGTVRGPKGKCINPDKCPKKEGSDVLDEEEGVGIIEETEKSCPPKEHISECNAHCQKNCTNYNKPTVCPAICVKGCVCDKGLVRSKDGKCVLPKQCPGRDVCPRGEHYDQCNAHCQRNCSTWGKPLPCPLKCEHGCVCDRGTVRGPKGKCITPDKCPKKEGSVVLDEDDGVDIIEETEKSCPPKEHINECNAHCQKNCTNYNKPTVCPAICVKGCVCDRGLVRGKDGKCVLPKQCPGRDVCPRGEHYDQCNAHCQRSCSTWGKPLPCPLKCEHGCICDRGTVRGPKGKCIKPDKCPKKEGSVVLDEDDGVGIIEATSEFCPPNEEYSPCEAHCEDDCAGRGTFCNRLCVSGCRCKKGFVRGPKGTCIKKEECTSRVHPRRRVCPKDEKFEVCSAHCQHNCTNVARPRPCPLICIRGCICKPGLIRDLEGRCIPRDQCPSTNIYSCEETSQEESTRIYESLEEDSTRYDEELIRTQEEDESTLDAGKCPFGKDKVVECLNFCERECYYRNKDNPSPCFNVCKLGCLCHQESDGKQDGQFPIPIFCKKNEVFSVCPCAVDCVNYETKKCPLCIPGCECKSGYVRGPEGTCIRKDECPGDKKPEDCTLLEFYDSCGSACPDDCTNYNQQDRQCTKNCKVGCFCIPGLVRGPNRECLFPFECPPKTPFH